jgi:beta-lactamase
MKINLSHIGFLAFFLFFSCSKKESTTTTNGYYSASNLPNFGNVDVDNVFKGEKLKLENQQKIVNSLNQYYENIWNSADMSGGVLVAHGDNILLEKYKGFGRENNQMPINKDTPLHLASISKPITAMAVLKLVEAKKISLEQKVKSIFPNFPYPDVTIQHLLTHRSGLPKYEHFLEENDIKPKNQYFTNQEIFDIVAKHKPELARQTDTGFMYNNFNYAILALIIEKITGKTYPEAMKEMVFAPLKMKNTFVFEEKHINSASQSFYQRSSKLYPLDQYDLIYGDKNIYTTPRDLFNFSKALFSKDFLPKELMEKIFEPYSNEKKGVNNYGLGFRLKIFNEGKKLTYHNGWWHGSNTVFIHLREFKTTIIALSNKYSRKIYGTMLLSTLFEDFPFEVDKVINPDAETADSANAFVEDTERAKAPKKKPKKTSADSLKAPKTEERIQKTPESTNDED